MLHPFAGQHIVSDELQKKRASLKMVVSDIIIDNLPFNVEGDIEGEGGLKIQKEVVDKSVRQASYDIVEFMIRLVFMTEFGGYDLPPEDS
jgi:hypothetical protein